MESGSPLSPFASSNPQYSHTYISSNPKMLKTDEIFYYFLKVFHLKSTERNLISKHVSFLGVLRCPWRPPWANLDNLIDSFLIQPLRYQLSYMSLWPVSTTKRCQNLPWCSLLGSCHIFFVVADFLYKLNTQNLF